MSEGPTVTHTETGHWGDAGPTPLRDIVEELTQHSGNQAVLLGFLVEALVTVGTVDTRDLEELLLFRMESRYSEITVTK